MEKTSFQIHQSGGSICNCAQYRGFGDQLHIQLTTNEKSVTVTEPGTR